MYENLLARFILFNNFAENKARGWSKKEQTNEARASVWLSDKSSAINLVQYWTLRIKTTRKKQTEAELRRA